RYIFIGELMKSCYNKKNKGRLSISDKIDKVVTNRWLALPIFALIMFLVYYVSVTTIGTKGTDWVNDGVFGDGWHVFAIGSDEFSEADERSGDAMSVINEFVYQSENEELAALIDSESEEYDAEAAVAAVRTFASGIPASATADYTLEDEETLATEDVTFTGDDLRESVAVFEEYNGEAPDPADYGIFVPSIPSLVETALDNAGAAEWLKGLILDGIIAGVGAVLGFVPQILVLFIFLAFLEACGYMARIAFVMDRIFRRFGLSGKSFIPILIGTGCGIPGIMASRTIENERDRRMTIMTTTFIPCGAKLPFIAMIAGSIFGGAAWVAPLAYFIGIAAIIISGIILKKTKMFSGDPAPFVMELPAYHWPTVGNVLRSMWERGWSFIKKAGTIILLSTIVIWFLSRFGFGSDGFGMLAEEELDRSILAGIGNALSWIFIPLGWGNWQATVASITGLVAKENIVGTLGILYGGGTSVYATMHASFTQAAGMSFLCFNLLCAPCFAAIGAIKREMNNHKWTWFAIGYQCLFAYIIGFIVYNIGTVIGGLMTPAVIVGLIISILVIIFGLYMLFRKNKNAAGYIAKA
ncbi:MAG: ferrous iron transporter B, partial [Lachnospiraceae bacterium]|nr:ferrous iron transporter B [Lachnospiraceae bacterium]